jgi:hypothetical protein
MLCVGVGVGVVVGERKRRRLSQEKMNDNGIVQKMNDNGIVHIMHHIYSILHILCHQDGAEEEVRRRRGNKIQYILFIDSLLFPPGRSGDATAATAKATPPSNTWYKSSCDTQNKFNY